MTTKLAELAGEKRAPAIERYGDGRPVRPEPPTRDECLEKRREAAKKIAELRKRHEPLVQQAEARLHDAELRLTAAKEVLRESEKARLDASQTHDSTILQRDAAIGEQERIIRENPDVQLARIVSELENELFDVRQNYRGKGDGLKRIARLENAITAAHELHADPGIINTITLDAHLVRLAIMRND